MNELNYVNDSNYTDSQLIDLNTRIYIKMISYSSDQIQNIIDFEKKEFDREIKYNCQPSLKIKLVK